MKNIKTDIFGIVPQIGDIIVFNPPHYKGLLHFECVGFSEAGLPEVNPNKHIGATNSNGRYTPKTGFVVIKK